MPEGLRRRWNESDKVELIIKEPMNLERLNFHHLFYFWRVQGERI
jgi:hypothetical protein